MTGLLQLALNIVDGKVFLSHGDCQLAYTVTGRSGLGAMFDVLEKGCAFFRVMAKLVTEDAESSGGISEALSNGERGKFFDKEAAQGFILFVKRLFGLEEETFFLRYCISIIYIHIMNMLLYIENVNRAKA